MKLETLNRLTVTVTAFESWAEFEAAMRGGYCPTLRKPTTRRSANRGQKRFDRAVVELARLVRRAGYKVFDGRRVR